MISWGISRKPSFRTTLEMAAASFVASSSSVALTMNTSLPYVFLRDRKTSLPDESFRSTVLFTVITLEKLVLVSRSST